jgi:hypothetical protein
LALPGRVPAFFFCNIVPSLKVDDVIVNGSAACAGVAAVHAPAASAPAATVNPKAYLFMLMVFSLSFCDPPLPDVASPGP